MNIVINIPEDFDIEQWGKKFNKKFKVLLEMKSLEMRFPSFYKKLEEYKKLEKEYSR